MKHRLFAMAVSAALTLAAFNALAQTSVKSQRMIVVLKPSEVARQVARVGERIDNVFVDQRYQKSPKLWNAVSLPTALLIRDLENQHGARAGLAFGAFSHGFASDLTTQQVESLKADARVQSVFPDAVGTLAANWTNLPEVTYSSTYTRGWNVSAIGADTASSRYRTDSDYPVKAFVLDAGVQPHADLNYNPSTSAWSFDIHGNPDEYGNSCTPHATHVAGIIGAYRSPANVGVEGVAPGAVIWSMKIINYCRTELDPYPGLVYMSSVLTAINAIDGQTGIPKQSGVAQQRLRAVANMSVLWDAVGGPLFMDLEARKLLRSTMKTAVDNGIFFSVAGGNAERNAAEFYPGAVGCALYDPAEPGVLQAAVGGVMGVGAIQASGAPMDRSGYEAGKIASYGGCVKIWAPGQSVYSTVAQTLLPYPSEPGSPIPYPLVADMSYWNPWKGQASGYLGQHYYDEMSGSSMAAPHIAGAALLYAKLRQADGQALPYPWEIENFLLSRSAASVPAYHGSPVNLINVSGW